MSSSPSPERTSLSDRERSRAFLRQAVPAGVLLLLTQGSLVLVNPQHSSSAAGTVWALSPIVPALWLVWIQVQALRRADELQRQTQLESLAIGFAVMVLCSLVGGVLDGASIGHPAQFLQISFIAGILAWAGALAITSRSR